jgi:hypothetical protein
MRHAYTTLSILLVAVLGCTSTSVEDLPPIVNQLIAQHKAAPKRNPPSSIWRYKYKGLVVFYVSPACCDIPSELYSSDGKLVCSPDGGITGNGDGKCSDFFATRTDEQLVWSDKR